MKSIIISIGDELLAGDITNTNSTFIAAELNRYNIAVDKIVTVGDDFESIICEFNTIPDDIELVFVSGGLGPTHDDMTKKVAVDFFETKLVYYDDLYQNLVERFRQRGYIMTAANKTQAYLPESCERIINTHGTATGMKFKRDNKSFYFMPGVPHEMKAMMSEQILPSLPINTDKRLFQKIIRTNGVGESNLYDGMKEWIAENPEVKVAFYPKYYGNDIKLQYPKNSSPAIDKLIEHLGKVVYGFDNESIEQKIAEKLVEKNLTISVAESCTGGLISNRLTDISGSSQYMMQGMITYSNDAKMNLLGVKKETLDKHGAVSEKVALEMANGVRKSANTDIGISTTGIAGPTGGTPEKPLGTLRCAVSIGEETEAFHYCRNINREANKILFSQFIFKKLLEKLY